MSSKDRGVIAAGHEKTAEAGQIMFELGGNAFDAAIAATLTAFVAESALASVGGGGFLLAHTQDNRDILFDFFCQTPRYQKDLNELDFYPVHINFGGEIQTFHIGLGSIATPGNLAGVWEVQKQLGKLPFNVVAQPAIDCAKNGFCVGNFNAFIIELLKPILTRTTESQKIYAPDGELLSAGKICYMKDFAATLTELCERGIKDFYQGAIAHQIVKDLSKEGYLTLEDFNNYRIIKRKPLKIRYRGYELLTNPPPSSGGVLIGFALKLLESIDLSHIEHGSREHLQILAQVMRLTNEARKDGYDSCLYQENIEQKFLSDRHVENYRSQLHETVNKLGNTTHISTLDREGNAASVTITNGEGSSYVIPGTGIMLNNMLGEADLNPLGFHQWKRDRRMSSMMSPTIVLKEGQPEIVLGSGGSNRIRTAILQVISNLLDFNLSLEKAVESPRVHWENNTFSIEPFPQLETSDRLQLPEATQAILWPKKNLFFGGVHTVRKNPNGTMEGIGDSRREGAFSVISNRRGGFS
jgi:gamma-glutamyltranspeptidase / glutathione hydrolase